MSVSSKDEKKSVAPKGVKKENEKQSDDIRYSYCYILSTVAQRKALDLTKHKAKLQKTIKSYFSEQLVSVEVYPDHYYLVLSEPFSIAQKRRLGRLISEECNFRAYVHKVIYNNAQDTSGQLFRLCTEKDKTVNQSSVARKGI